MAKPRQVEVPVGQGKTVGEAARAIGVTVATHDLAHALAATELA